MKPLRQHNEPQIRTRDATRHDWDRAMARCESCSVSKEFVARFGAVYCKARLARESHR